MSEPISRNRTADRDFDIWQRYTQGETQQQLAEHFGIAQQTVSFILARMRDDIPVEERRARQRRQIADLDHLRREALELVEADPTPAYSNGKPILLADGVTIAEDHTGRVRAMDLVVKLQEREAKALGTDAATRISVEAEQAGERIKALLRRAVAPQPDDDTA
jgi:transcriptional regulator with XRE-family HTH domain